MEGDLLLASQACGSGGTAAGVALGNRLSGMGASIWAYGVCDDPDYFYGFIQGLLDGLGARREVIGIAMTCRWLSCRANTTMMPARRHVAAVTLAHKVVLAQ